MKIKALILLTLLTACSTPLRINVPAMRFESSELEGLEKSSAFSFGLQTYNEAELSSDTRSIPVHAEPTRFDQYFTNKPNTNLFDALTGIFTDHSYLYFKLSHAFDAPLELSYRFPDRIGAKLQIFGPRADVAKAGDVSMALTTSYASRSTESVIGADPATNPTDSSIKFSRVIVDAAVVGGVRLSDTWLLYGGPFILHTPYKVEQILNTTTNTLYINGQVNTFGGNAGLQYRNANGFSLKLEAVLNRIEGHRSQEDFVNAGLVLSKSF